ncbi:hypothetical protein AA106555_1268 [Neokomagataea thailandica NBRC 106555]|uniref:Uncharacterized protein n=2 Tax=Neokomagataea TaxID=1223423 RepID=A0A4Y6V322_9PROT|nr:MULTISPECIES: hypothetical protein [Neokomagataea]QDH24383.1 hypothetical protein D5366_02955 [Neokomagataea tanensis]GBR53355.1 hypothetical protein AA106555_1268 [Neokomagataea thailandica NBRC 106555]
MSPRLSGALVALLCVSYASTAPARAADADWGAAKCGAEPAAPALRVGNVTQYNESVDRVTAYEKQARTYNACVVAAANRAETAISDDARARIAEVHKGSTAVQSRIAANFQKLSGVLATAGKHFAAK